MISKQTRREVLMDERRVPYILNDLVTVREGLKDLTTLVDSMIEQLREYAFQETDQRPNLVGISSGRE